MRGPFRAPRDFIFREELAELEALNANLSITVAMSRPGGEPGHGTVGHIDAALLASAVPDIASQRAHICGPPPMMDAVKAAGVMHGYAETEVFSPAVIKAREYIEKGGIGDVLTLRSREAHSGAGGGSPSARVGRAVPV